MQSPKEHLIDWLRDAHAMEEQAKNLLTQQINRLESYPEALPRLQEHLRETERQRVDIEQALKDLGADTSALKDVATKLMASMQGFAHMLASDEVLKHMLASHAFEQYEAGCYHSLAAAADEAGEPRIAQMARNILAEEQRMAGWVWDQIPPTTQKFLRRDAAETPAKV